MLRKMLDPRVWIPGVLGILALTIPWISTGKSQGVRVPSQRPARIGASEGPTPPSAAAVQTEPVAESCLVREASPSPEIRKSPPRLREWLVGLPLADLKPLIGTKKLDGYVIRALSSSQELDAEAEQFLTRLNERIRAARSL